MKTWGWVAVAAVAFGPAAAAGQAIDGAVTGMEEGSVRFVYATRPGVQVCDGGVRIHEDDVRWSAGEGYGCGECRDGTAEVELRVVDGTVRDVSLVRPGRATNDGTAAELGEVSAREAATYLMGLASGGGPVRAAEAAILPAVIADVDGIWRELLTLARDRAAPSRVRRSALFWIGQEAADAVTEGLAAVATASEEDQEIRDAAVFALSQQPDETGVPILMDLARSAPQPGTRRSAMFWLAQSDDDRVTAFFEEILIGSGGL